MRRSHIRVPDPALKRRAIGNSPFGAGFQRREFKHATKYVRHEHLSALQSSLRDFDLSRVQPAAEAAGY